MSSPRIAAALAALVFSVTLVGCGADVVPAATPTPTPTLTPTGDGVLRVGTLFATSGDLAFLGTAQVAAVELAVRDINEAGGVAGEPVEVFHRDSGAASSDRAEESFAELVEKGADVVIGPTSSVIAERLLPLAAEAGVTLITPSATYPALTTADTTDVLFRTAPSYAHQGAVLATVLADAERIVLLHGDDDVAGSIEPVLSAALASGERDILHAGVVPGDVDELDGAALDALVQPVLDARPDAVVLATLGSASEATAAVAEALVDGGVDASALWFTTQNVADYSELLDDGVLDGAKGLLDGAIVDDQFAARLAQADPAVRNTRFAPEAYDATVLAALAAVLSDDDGGPSIAWSLRAVSAEGIPCTSFGACLDVLRTEPDIDYGGVSGALDLDPSGDVAAAPYSVVRYGDDNDFERVDGIVG